jgi:galactose mutarotase-like enzyme
MWQADPNYWGRHSCILFPFVGKLNNDRYRAGGETFSMGQHGFARDMPFEVVASGDDFLELALESTPVAIEKFPFPFRLTAAYRLEGNTLEIRYMVENTGEGLLYFSIGAHPGFNCPLKEGEKRSDYRLRFNRPETAVSYLLQNGLLSGKTANVLKKETDLPISDSLFDQDALIFKGLASDSVSLVNKEGKAILTVGFPETPYLGIWSKSQDSPFVCIEPWFGLADQVGFEGDISDKEGINCLAPEELFSCVHTITIGD